MPYQTEFDAGANWGRVSGWQRPSSGIGTHPFDPNGAAYDYLELDYPTVLWFFNTGANHMPILRDSNRGYLAGGVSNDKGWAMEFKPRSTNSQKPAMVFRVTPGPPTNAVILVWPGIASDQTKITATREWLTAFYDASRTLAAQSVSFGNNTVLRPPWFGPPSIQSPITPPNQVVHE